MDWQRLYDFWFGVPGTPSAELDARMPLWFGKCPKADAAARDFVPWLAAHRRGETASWRETARGTATLVVLLDQIPRNAFRGLPESFSFDRYACEVTLEALEKGVDRKLNHLERLFLYLPLEHAEDGKLQELSVRKFRERYEAASYGEKAWAAENLDYAVKHQLIIERFGRFPHRNSILGRESTEEERVFLLEPGSSF